MTQREANIVRRGILKSGYKISVLYSGPTSVVVRLFKKANKTWTPAFRGSSEKNILAKLGLQYPLALTKKERDQLKKFKIKAVERKQRAEDAERQLNEDVAAIVESEKQNRAPAELRPLCSAV